MKLKKELGMAWPVTPGEGAVTGLFLGSLPVSLSEMMVFGFIEKSCLEE